MLVFCWPSQCQYDPRSGPYYSSEEPDREALVLAEDQTLRQILLYLYLYMLLKTTIFDVGSVISGFLKIRFAFL